jgi:hypothetical protein
MVDCIPSRAGVYIASNRRSPVEPAIYISDTDEDEVHQSEDEDEEQGAAAAGKKGGAKSKPKK